jgi:hypothetical protein
MNSPELSDSEFLPIPGGNPRHANDRAAEFVPAAFHLGYLAIPLDFDEFRPGSATGGGGVDASGPMSWIARAGGHKVAIRKTKRSFFEVVPKKNAPTKIF